MVLARAAWETIWQNIAWHNATIFVQNFQSSERIPGPRVIVTRVLRYQGVKDWRQTATGSMLQGRFFFTRRVCCFSFLQCWGFLIYLDSEFPGRVRTCHLSLELFLSAVRNSRLLFISILPPYCSLFSILKLFSCLPGPLLFAMSAGQVLSRSAYS